jgi:hypothetical protein
MWPSAKPELPNNFHFETYRQAKTEQEISASVRERGNWNVDKM